MNQTVTLLYKMCAIVRYIGLNAEVDGDFQ